MTEFPISKRGAGVVILDEVNGFASVGGLYRSADLEQLLALLEGTAAQVVAVAVEER